LKVPEKQVLLTDPDAGSMKAPSNGMVVYNVRTAVKAGHHLIVAPELTN